ncbi:MAG: amino acid ABC transporter ATP-binding protein [Vulcanimicrobiaceae bacterium]
MIELVDVEKHYGTLHALRRITATIAKGEVVVVIGASGSGKSTLLRCINALETVDGGRILVDGDLIVGQPASKTASLRAEIGMVFQSFNLFPHMSALHNVMTGPVQVRGTSKKLAREKAVQLLERVGLADKLNAYPAQLSGGQQQRVAIARALAMEPKVMLFDEPTSALDPETIDEVLDVMRGLAHSGMTMMIATHEMGFARDVANRVLFMDAGAIVEEAPAAQFFTQPATDRARLFLRKLLRERL